MPSERMTLSSRHCKAMPWRKFYLQLSIPVCPARQDSNGRCSASTLTICTGSAPFLQATDYLACQKSTYSGIPMRYLLLQNCIRPKYLRCAKCVQRLVSRYI
ncbi:hypothetical protein BST61_g2999 [Cercospora zeina]